ncbi:hypothetical protein BAUCODRAFT_417087 [Baudoinia panamericana UAMH 10762]|uniref:N-acetyltransferase domain-containing protein n=1 Tax=Baudoinia panamericana (strain UAMH 10762) TaxID=717646 RepID=M2MNG0_BAUPA|nr:uncharacterized protein BAUCODRAFT_417087 [Baudoinia panamericana UAMH 10762]EMC98221.1 hypothetical protein BAUCODRAFT_417087 [Baudoinia panamericana UAMH 10762]
MTQSQEQMASHLRDPMASGSTSLAMQQALSPYQRELYLGRAACEHRDEQEHPHITNFAATLYLHLPLSADKLNFSADHPAGMLKGQLLDAANMRNICLGQMWLECQAYDVAHCDEGTKLNKVENYLANELFKPEYEGKVATAKKVLHIESVWVEERLRGQGLGRWMVAEIIHQLGLKDVPAIVLLQAGPLARERRCVDGATIATPARRDCGTAHEKLTRY